MEDYFTRLQCGHAESYARNSPQLGALIILLTQDVAKKLHRWRRMWLIHDDNGMV